MKNIIEFAKIKDLEFLVKNDKHISEKFLLDKIKRNEVLIVKEENIIIGWLRYNFFWDMYPFMTMLFLLEENRNKGFGKKLVEYWEKLLFAQGYNTFFTSTMANEEAQHFYRKLGYKDAGGFVLGDEPFEIILIKNIY